MSVSIRNIRPSVLRNLSTVSLHKVAQIIGQIVAVFTIPRLLGADDHGHFSFVIAFAYILQIMGDFGTLEVMSRFVPSLAPEEANQLYTRTVFFKLLVGFVCGLLALGSGLILAPWLRLEWAVLFGIGVAAHIVAWVPFKFMLGLNQVGYWMVEQSWRQWVLIILLLPLYPWLGVGGSILAWTLMEVIFCGLGLWWARTYWVWPEMRFEWSYLAPYVRFGLGFFLANLVSAVLYRSGPVLVETLTRQPAEAGYINLALGLYLMPYLLLTQMALSLVPSLSEFYDKGQTAKLQEWIDNFIRYSWLLGWLGVIGVWLTVDWATPVVFGQDYITAAPVFKWISLGIPLAGILWAGNAISTVTGQGQVKFAATLTALGVFLVAAWVLIPLYAAAGAAIAMSLAITVNILFLIIALRADFCLPWPLVLSSGGVALVLLGLIEVYNLSVANWGIF